MLKNKKAAIGETMTWIIATLIILVVLSIFIYGSHLLGKFKYVSSGEIEVEDGKDLLKTKTDVALSKNRANTNRIKTWILQEKEYG